MEKIFAAITMVCMSTIFFSYYSYTTYKGRSQPPLSFSLIIWIGVVISLISFLISPEGDILTGITNFSDSILCGLFVIVVFFFSKGTTDQKIKKFERKYLVGVIIIILFWIITNNATITNIVTQILLIYGYAPMVEKIVTEKEKTESEKTWFLSLVVCLCSLWPASMGNGFLPYLYSGRAIVMVSIIIFLIHKHELKRQSFSKSQV